MSRYLLDTNIVSDAARPVPSEPLVAWLAEQRDDSLFIASLSLAEIHRGVFEMPPGKKRRQLEEWLQGPEGPKQLFSGRVLPFDDRAALAWGRLMAEGTRSGQPRSALDMIIAATAEAHGCSLVTNNEKHFWWLKVINPMRR